MSVYNTNGYAIKKFKGERDDSILLDFDDDGIYDLYIEKNKDEYNYLWKENGKEIKLIKKINKKFFKKKWYAKVNGVWEVYKNSVQLLLEMR